MRILVVEDDLLLGDALATGLRQLGHVVDWFGDGTQADAALAVTTFDAVVLDLGLPGEDGLAWLARWRRAGVAVPMLILTARDGAEHSISGLDGGADDYLVKPISIDELAARLRAVMRRTSGRAQPVWQHGALEYDPAHKQVRWKGEAVDLTGRELALLENDGTHLNEEQLASLGTRFHRPQGQAEIGSGLGVSIVQRIAALHGLGVVFGTGDSGQGVRVTVQRNKATRPATS